MNSMDDYEPSYLEEFWDMQDAFKANELRALAEEWDDDDDDDNEVSEETPAVMDEESVTGDADM